MKGRISNPQGDVMIRTDVIAKYAGSMACGMLRHCWYGQCQHEGWTCSSAEKGQHNKRH